MKLLRASEGSFNSFEREFVVYCLDRMAEDRESRGVVVLLF